MKIKNLLATWPNGTVGTSKWLNGLGIYQQLVHHYEGQGWIKKIGKGAYKKINDPVEWTGAIFAIQSQLNSPIYPGAGTALELLGHNHYVRMGTGAKLLLLTPKYAKLPTWFVEWNWDINFNLKVLHLFDKPLLHLTKFDLGSYSLQISNPERAMIEVCSLVSNYYTFENAVHFMQGLMTLRPQIVQELLENCKSIKAKRLFLYLADTENMPWFNKINLAHVNLGHGIRAIEKGGRFNSQYRITVAKTFVSNEIEDIP